MRFPQNARHQEERKDGSLLAFFTDTYEHIVMKHKEMLAERPHGHILLSGDNLKLGAKVMATTSFMYGIFNSHVVVGNTNMNKMMSNARAHLMYQNSGTADLCGEGRNVSTADHAVHVRNGLQLCPLVL